MMKNVSTRVASRAVSENTFEEVDPR